VKVHRKYSTLVTYESALHEHLLPEIGDRELRTIDEPFIAALQAKVGKDRSPKTVRNVMGVLSSALHIAEEWGYIDRVPAFKFPSPGKARFRFLQLDECIRLEKASTPYWLVMVGFARKAGLRLGELCALEWEQFNFRAGTVHVDRAVWRGKVSLPKHDKVRTVDLSPKTVALLQEYRRASTDRLVFPTAEGRMRLDRKCDQGLRRCATRAGLEPFGWHVLRHTYASHLVMRGVPIPVVQQLMGHADIRLTMRYAHLSPGQTSWAVAKLDDEAAELGQQLGSEGPGNPRCLPATDGDDGGIT
jgi:integrase